MKVAVGVLVSFSIILTISPTRGGPNDPPSRTEVDDGLIESGFTVIVGGGYLGMLEDDRPSFSPGAYLGAGPAPFLLALWQMRSKPEDFFLRIGGGYLGAYHPYRDADGGTWANRISLYVDYLYRFEALQLGMRAALGLGLGSLGDAYEADHGKTRDMLGFYAQVGWLTEYVLVKNFWLGVELAGTIDGWLGNDSENKEDMDKISLGGMISLYVGYHF